MQEKCELIVGIEKIPHRNRSKDQQRLFSVFSCILTKKVALTIMALPVGILVLFMMLNLCACDTRRPFYNIAHMVNSIRQVEYYLDRGANAFELDIQFFSDGSVKETYHGVPCDCFRVCTRSANLQEYLLHVRHITDPSVPGNYARQLVLLLFDLKLAAVRFKKNAGRNLATHVLDYLWSEDRKRNPEIRVSIYIKSESDIDVYEGFIEEFKRRGLESHLKDVGFEGGTEQCLRAIQRMFVRQKVEGNLWLSDGITNCLSTFRSSKNLRMQLARRDSSPFIQKVYHWTIDVRFRMRRSLYLDVDGMITNYPSKLYQVLNEVNFSRKYKLATPQDNPFQKYTMG